MTQGIHVRYAVDEVATVHFHHCLSLQLKRFLLFSFGAELIADLTIAGALRRKRNGSATPAERVGARDVSHIMGWRCDWHTAARALCASRKCRCGNNAGYLWHVQELLERAWKQPRTTLDGPCPPAIPLASACAPCKAQ